MNPIQSDTSHSVASLRDMLFLTTFATLATSSAAPEKNPASSPAEDAEQKKSQALPDLVVEASRSGERLYNPANLSSNKMTAPLLDTPQTFTVVPKEIYNQQNARTLADVLKNVPGISYNAGENGFGSGMANFSMRGVSSVGSVYQDGVRDNGNYLRDIFNIERVEVAKGPAADFGRGTAGGYVNMVTKAPTLADFFKGSTSFAMDETDASGRFRTSFDVNQHLAGSALEGTAVRLNVLFQEGGAPGRDFAEQNSWGVAPSLSIGLGTRTRTTVAFQHIEQNDIPDWGVPSGNTSTGSGFGGVRRINRDAYYGLTSDYDDTVSDALLFRIEHDLTPDLTLANQTRIAKTDRKSDFTMPFGYTNPAATSLRQERTRYDRENFSLSNITSLDYTFHTGSLEHSLAAGLELSREESKARRYTSVNRTTSAANPDNSPVGFPIPAYRGTGEVTVDSAAIYLYDTVKLNEHWQITGGLRAEYYEVELEDRDAVGAPGPNSYKKDDTTLSGKLGLVYKPAKNGSIYASAGVSALPPGSLLSNSDASREGANGFPGGGVGINSPTAKTQQNLNYEIGTKWDFFQERLSTTVAVFRTERHDVAITGLPHLGGVATGAPLATGYHEQVIQGVELGISGKVTDAWTVFGGLLLMDSERQVDPYWVIARQLAQPGDYNAVYRNFDGDELAYTPNYTANLWSTYRLPGGVTLGGGMQYVSTSYAGRPDDAERIIPNGRYGKLNDYITFGALAEYEVNKNFTVRLNVDNVFDEVYAVSANWSGTRAQVGPPRTYTISADWSF